MNLEKKAAAYPEGTFGSYQGFWRLMRSDLRTIDRSSANHAMAFGGSGLLAFTLTRLDTSHPAGLAEMFLLGLMAVTVRKTWLTTYRNRDKLNIENASFPSNLSLIKPHLHLRRETRYAAITTGIAATTWAAVGSATRFLTPDLFSTYLAPTQESGLLLLATGLTAAATCGIEGFNFRRAHVAATRDIATQINTQDRRIRNQHPSPS